MDTVRSKPVKCSFAESKRFIIEIKAEIYSCFTTSTENVDKLKQCMNKLGREDIDSTLYDYIVLQSFKNRWTETFNYLVSLPRCSGTPILLNVMPLTRPENDNYALKLVENGADIHCRDSDGNSVLHYGITRGCCHLSQVLIDSGVNVNARNFAGDTALHSVIITTYPFNKRRLCAVLSYLGNHLLYDREIDCSSNLMELLSILLFKGAEPAILNRKGHTAADLAVMVYEICENRSENDTNELYLALQLLYNYTYYDVVPCHILLLMMQIDLPFLDQCFDEITEIIIDYHFLEINIGWSLFSIDVKYLKKLIDKFEHVITDLLEYNIRTFYTNKICLENFEALLESHLANYAMDFIREIRIQQLIDSYYNNIYQRRGGISEESVFEIIYYLLSYGLEVYQDDLESVFNNFGYCELFKFLLKLDIQKNCCKQDIWVSLLCNFGETDLEKFFKNPERYSLKNISQLLFYYSHPRLKDFFREKRYDNKQVIDQVKRLPQVPLLQELARNVFRKYFIETFNIQSSKQFYYMLKCLPIGVIHQKIISLEQRLYY